MVCSLLSHFTDQETETSGSSYCLGSHWLFEDWDSLTTTIYWKLIMILVMCFIYNTHFIHQSHPEGKCFIIPTLYLRKLKLGL